MPLLRVKELNVAFPLREGDLTVVEGISFDLNEGGSLGIVGESGCGKSVTSSSIARLVPSPGRISSGEILWNGANLIKLSRSEMSKTIRGREIAMIFQNPRAALNPVLRIGKQLTLVLRKRRGLSKIASHEEAIMLLRSVHIPDPERRMQAYAHELSGGTAQRVMIALAMSCRPKLLIADEPTTGLDVTTAAQVIHLIREQQRETGMALLMITHDLPLATKVCDDLVVMYAGRICEKGPSNSVYYSPRHPYSAALLECQPFPGQSGDIKTIPGEVTSMANPVSGCRFHPRCSHASDVCRSQAPSLNTMAEGHLAACHHPLPSRTLGHTSKSKISI